MIATAKIIKSAHSQLLLAADEQITREIAQKHIGSVEIRLNDGRTISNDQRKKIFAIIRDISVWSGHDPEYLRQFRENITAAAEFGWKRVITLSGVRGDISDADGMTACETILKEAVKIATDHNVTICMELLNSKVDHPGYMCDHTSWGVELCKRVDSPHFKLLYDIYHMQIMEGDVIRTIRDNITYIDHFHTAGNPGRNDLDENQELFYPAIMRAIAQLQEEGKFNGYVAHEFGPKNGIESLRKAVQLCDV